MSLGIRKQNMREMEAETNFNKACHTMFATGFLKYQILPNWTERQRKKEGKE